MKKTILLMTLILSIGSWQTTQAQHISLNININLDSQPDWGPVGYDYAPYYYIPALNVYYEVNTARFYYMNGPVWVCANVLPPMYRRYDLYSLYKVVLHDRTPWAYNRLHHQAYRNYRRVPAQPTIRRVNDYHYAPGRAMHASAPSHNREAMREPARNNRDHSPARVNPAPAPNNRPAQSAQSSQPARNKEMSNNSSSNRNAQKSTSVAPSSNRTGSSNNNSSSRVTASTSTRSSGGSQATGKNTGSSNRTTRGFGR